MGDTENTAKARSTEKPSEPAQRGRTMGKETKIGLSVIGVLLVVFAGVLIVRLRNNDLARKPDSADSLVKDATALAEDDELAESEAQHERGSQGSSRRNTSGGKAGSKAAPSKKPQRQDAWSSRKTAAAGGTASATRLAASTNAARRQSSSPRQSARNRQDPWHTDSNDQDEEAFDPTDDAWDTHATDADADASDDSSWDSNGPQDDPYAEDDQGYATDEPQAAPRATGGFGRRGGSPSAPTLRIDRPAPEPTETMPGYDDDEDAKPDAAYLSEDKPGAAEPPAPQRGGRVRPAATRTAGRAGAEPDHEDDFGTSTAYGRSQATPPDGNPDDGEADAPFPRQEDTYTVQPNDNYWSISRAVYGTGAYFKALYEHNRDRYPYPDQLRAGDVIDTPPAAVLEQTYPDLCPQPRRAGRGSRLATSRTRPRPGSRTYVVREGDTLFDIARAELGRSSRWAELYELNRDVLGDDFDYLTPGMKLVLPAETPAEEADDAAPVTTQRPRRPNRR